MCKLPDALLGDPSRKGKKLLRQEDSQRDGDGKYPRLLYTLVRHRMSMVMTSPCTGLRRALYTLLLHTGS